MSDLISRADAIDARPEYRNEDMIDKEKATYNKGWNDCTDAWRAIIKALPSAVCDDCIWHVCNYNKVDWDAPSAEAKPTVIRSRTLMPTKDFREWARRIRETNPNAVVIPCDAEVVSAEAVQGEWSATKNDVCGIDTCGAEQRR